MTDQKIDNFRPLPDDFATFAPGQAIRDLRKRYGAGYETIKRWKDLCGITEYAPRPENYKSIPIPADFQESAPQMTITELCNRFRVSDKTVKKWLNKLGLKAKVARNYRTFNMMGRQPQLNFIGTPVRSIYEDAAEALRRDRWVVYRCTESGKYDEKGSFWLVGRVICSADELLERAERAKRKVA